MKHYSILLVTVLLCGLFFTGFNSPAQAQTCEACQPPEEIPITFSDGSDYLVTAYFTERSDVEQNTIEIVGNGFSITIDYAPDEIETAGVGFGVNNSTTGRAWGAGIINVSYSNWSWDPNPDEIPDLNVLPPEYRELCLNLIETCGELLENDEFWELLEDEDKVVLGILREEMELMRDGYGSPTSFDYFQDITLLTGGRGDDGRMWRGYSFDGVIGMTLQTTSPLGEQYPDIHISSKSSLDNERWNLHIDPEKQICEIWLDNVEAVQQVNEDDWGEWLESIRAGFEFYQDQLPLLLESGIIDPEFELDILIESGIYGLDNYPVEVTYPGEWSDSIL